MSKFVRLFLPIFILLLGFSLGKAFLAHKKKHQEKKVFLETTYPVQEQKSFVVLIPSYNNEKWCEKNIESVLEQDYPNYRVIYINDNSKDRTADKVKDFVKESSIDWTFINNSQRKGALQNIYEGVSRCKDHEIVVMLDGDDWFAHNKVLTKLNEIYANPNTWITYGQYTSYPFYMTGHCRDFEKNRSFREQDWVFSHLKTFYASLFKKINKEDLLFDQTFYQMSSDLAFMIPMLEMAGREHIQFIKDILYIYNRSNPINDDKVDRSYQITCEKDIRSKAKYEPLLELR